MENLNIAIVTDDKEYGKACGRAIINVCRTLVVNIFTKEEFAAVEEKDAVPADHSRFYYGFDIVLWDGPFCEERLRKGTIFLVDKPSMTCRNTQTGQYCIYKYSPAQQMIADIFEIYSRQTGRKPANISGHDVHVFAFCSWAGGCGCSTVAMAVAQELERFHNRRVFYMSLEELESTGEFIKCSPGGRTMSYYIYNLFKDKKNPRIRREEDGEEYRPFFESFIVRDDFGIEAFRPTKGRNPLVDLTSAEICTFVESVMNSGRYDVIVIDTGTSISEAALTCLEMAEKTCLVSRETGSFVRETHYLQYLMTLGGEDMLRKMIKVKNRVRLIKGSDYFNNKADEDESILPSSMTIGENNIYSEEAGIYKVLLEGNFGNNISKLTNFIVQPTR
ncbi:MAG: hypothetical protein Q4C80_00235 [Bacillota bacterium]|nr:hypothetical protein [Bacillota bacterium]